ncbi:hypothetical protein [Tichowtungia aerotolerans]|uniref:Lipoprotein n=1 Tax=Tichowtungia aerotolerans TaxID=2697043 RepID=A0A6P1MD25_9BACT|nr:hypothetical protein [Tichowtungia aerotolerans]QHI68995.1 hypothetical protein GT409_05875 [Tichowtungia aerotolerans]
MKKWFLLCAIFGLLAACTSYRSELSPSPGKCYVETCNRLFVETHIRFIDNGKELKTIDDQGRDIWTGDKSWLDPGEHTFTVVCECKYPWNKLVNDLPLTVELKKGYRYEIRADYDAKISSVEVKEHPHLTHGFFWTR